jgi:hypothetical protein
LQIRGYPPAPAYTHSIIVKLTLTEKGVLTAEAELSDHSVRRFLKVEKNPNPYRASELKAMFQVVQDPTIDDVEADEAMGMWHLNSLRVNLSEFFMAESSCVTYRQCVAPGVHIVIMDMVRRLEDRASPATRGEIRAIADEFRTMLLPYFQRTITPKWLAHV